MIQADDSADMKSIMDSYKKIIYEGSPDGNGCKADNQLSRNWIMAIAKTKANSTFSATDEHYKKALLAVLLDEDDKTKLTPSLQYVAEHLQEAATKQWMCAYTESIECRKGALTGEKCWKCYKKSDLIVGNEACSHLVKYVLEAENKTMRTKFGNETEEVIKTTVAPTDPPEKNGNGEDVRPTFMKMETITLGSLLVFFSILTENNFL